MLRYIKADISDIFDEDFDTTIAIADDFTTRPSTLAKLAKHSINSVRAAVAANPNTPIEILRELATDPDGYVRMQVSSNPTAAQDEELLVSLSRDANVYVRWGVYTNKAASEFFRESASEIDSHNVIRVDFIVPEQTDYTDYGAIEQIIIDAIDYAGYNFDSGYFTEGFDEYTDEYVAYCDLILNRRDSQKIEQAILSGMRELGFTNVSYDDDAEEPIYE